MGTPNTKTNDINTELNPTKDASDLLDKKTKSLDQALISDDYHSGGGQWDSEIKALLDNFTLKSMFFTEDWVFILLDLLASEISDVDMKVAKEEFTPDGRNVITWLDKHPLNKLIENPNPMQDYSTWMYLHVVEYCLMGNGIQWYAENLNQLHIIPAENVLIDRNEHTGKLSRYVINSQNGNGLRPTDMVILPPEQVIHQKRPNPVSIYWGLSPFVPNAKSLLFNKYTQDYLNSFYLKQATGQLALQLDKQVSEEAAMRLMRSFEHSYTGRRNQRRTMLLPKGVQIQEISQSIADQNIIAIVNQNREKIINILRVPKHALSLAETGSLGSEEFKISLKFMWTSAIKPIMKKIAGTFTTYFRQKGMLAENEKFMFDLSHIELLREDSIKTADLAIRQLEFKTLNEVRKDLYDLEPLDGGDAVPTREGAGEEEEVEEEVVEEEVENSANEILETKDDLGNARVKTLMHKFGTWFESNQKKIAETAGKTEDNMHKHMLNVFTDMARRSVRDFRSSFQDKNYYGPKKTKAASGSKKTFRDKLNESFGELEDEYLLGYTDSLLPAVETGYDTSLESVFNDNVRDRVGELGERDSNKRASSLRSRGIDSFEHISRTTQDQIIDIIDSGVADGKSVDNISNDIVAGFVEMGNARTDKIARTESFTAVSIGKKSALDNATEVVPNMSKVWINVGDNRVRGHPDGHDRGADHWKMQGEIVSAKGRDGKDKSFSNGLKYPRDVNGKPEERINCRCDMLMVSPTDLDQLQIARP